MAEMEVRGGDSQGFGHVPVLLDEVLAMLRPMPGETAVDATLGMGGHAVEMARLLGAGGRIIGFDLDSEHLSEVQGRFAQLAAKGGRGPEADSEAAGRGLAELTCVHGSFVGAPAYLRQHGVEADVFLADLGFSSTQMDDPTRGLSFRASGPLDMRLDRSRGMTAAALVNELDEKSLSDLIFRCGEEPYARKIARKLAQYRKIRTIDDTTTLARLVREAYGPRARDSRIDPATRTFMALRIAVNDELGALQNLLQQLELEASRLASDQTDHGARGWLRRGARVGLISFHSLEDRMVKQSLRRMELAGHADLLSRGPITAEPAEISRNPRARSAKLRGARIGASP